MKTSGNFVRNNLAAMLAAVLWIASGNVYAAAVSFTADIGDFIVPLPRGSAATAIGTFELNEAMDQLSYTISFFGLDLKADPADRTSAGDITAIHFHVGTATETSAEHVLNVFGFPAHDDGDLVVDYATETLSGIWDDGDLTDPLLMIPESAKSDRLTDRLTELLAGGLYVNVHTVQWPTGEIRGQISPIPLPAPVLLLTTALLTLCGASRRRAALPNS